MKQTRNGFTLVEVAMVIVIVAILSAIALPRFSGFNADARTVLLSGVESALKSAAAMTYAAYLKDGTHPEVLELQSSTVALQHGYPRADQSGILSAARLPANDFDIINDSSAEAAGSSTAVIRIRVAGARQPDACEVTYRAPAEAQSRPEIVRSILGC